MNNNQKDEQLIISSSLFFINFIRYTVFCCLFQGTAHVQHGWQSGRIKINSLIQIQSQYSDNVFRNDNDQKNDLITKVLPQAVLAYSFAPDNILSAEYKGDFRDYRNSDNFAKAHNHGKLPVAVVVTGVAIPVQRKKVEYQGYRV